MEPGVCVTLGIKNVMSFTHKVVKKNDLFMQPFNWMTET